MLPLIFVRKTPARESVNVENPLQQPPWLYGNTLRSVNLTRGKGVGLWHYASVQLTLCNAWRVKLNATPAKCYILTLQFLECTTNHLASSCDDLVSFAFCIDYHHVCPCDHPRDHFSMHINSIGDKTQPWNWYVRSLAMRRTPVALLYNVCINQNKCGRTQLSQSCFATQWSNPQSVCRKQHQTVIRQFEKQWND